MVLLAEEMDLLHKWFSRLYPDHKLKIYTKWNLAKAREEYILDIFFRSTSRSLAFQVPGDALEIEDVRQRIKERWLPWAQQNIIQTINAGV